MFSMRASCWKEISIFRKTKKISRQCQNDHRSNLIPLKISCHLARIRQILRADSLWRHVDKVHLCHFEANDRCLSPSMRIAFRKLDAMYWNTEFSGDLDPACIFTCVSSSYGLGNPLLNFSIRFRHFGWWWLVLSRVM